MEQRAAAWKGVSTRGKATCVLRTAARETGDTGKALQADTKIQAGYS